MEAYFLPVYKAIRKPMDSKILVYKADFHGGSLTLQNRTTLYVVPDEGQTWNLRKY